MSPSIGRKPRPGPTPLDHDQSSELAEVIWALVVERGNPAQVLELLYWSEEPGFFELIRGLAAVSPEAREALRSFFAAAPSPQIIAAAVEKRERLVLSYKAGQEVTRFGKSSRATSNA